MRPSSLPANSNANRATITDCCSPCLPKKISKVWTSEAYRPGLQVREEPALQERVVRGLFSTPSIIRGLPGSADRMAPTLSFSLRSVSSSLLRSVSASLSSAFSRRRASISARSSLIRSSTSRSVFAGFSCGTSSRPAGSDLLRGVSGGLASDVGTPIRKRVQ